MKYKCPWCGSTNTQRQTYSYVNHFIKGTFCHGGNIALSLLTQGRGIISQMAGNGGGNALEEMMKHGCYDCKCNNCNKDFFVYYDEREDGKLEILRYAKHD